MHAKKNRLQYIFDIFDWLLSISFSSFHLFIVSACNQQNTDYCSAQNQTAVNKTKIICFPFVNGVFRLFLVDGWYEVDAIFSSCCCAVRFFASSYFLIIQQTFEINNIIITATRFIVCNPNYLRSLSLNLCPFWVVNRHSLIFDTHSNFIIITIICGMSIDQLMSLAFRCYYVFYFML